MSTVKLIYSNLDFYDLENDDLEILVRNVPLKWSTVVDHIDKLPFRDDKVGTKKSDDFYDLQNRKSKSMGGFKINHEALKNYNFKLHFYEKDGLFVKHADKYKGENHCGTLLLFPPAKYSPFEGGDLIMHFAENRTIKIKPSKFRHWTLIMFSLNLHHECSPVVSGKRFLFKCDFIGDGDDYEVFNKFVESIEDRSKRSKYSCYRYSFIPKFGTNVSHGGKYLTFYNVCPADLESEESDESELDDGGNLWW